MMDYLAKYWTEIFAVVTGIIYIFLEVKQNKWMWIVGFVNSLVFVFVFFEAKIYAYTAMYGYYVLISVYGYFRWAKGIENGKLKVESGACEVRGARDEVECALQEHPVPRTPHLAPRYFVFVYIIISVILSAAAGYALAHFTDSPIPYYDGLTTGFSIVATWMLAQKNIQHWYFWIGIDIFCVPLYASQGLYLTAMLFFIYFIMSIIGLREWKKDLQKTR